MLHVPVSFSASVPQTLTADYFLASLFLFFFSFSSSSSESSTELTKNIITVLPRR